MSTPNPFPSGQPGSVSNGYSYPTRTFYNIEYTGEPAIARSPVDNPPFEWPKKTYTDINNQVQTIQRGYIRSLVTDPDVINAYAGASGAPNRRVFFQFNPQVLYRSVQQSVGAMNPLLQDPAQLAQAVPGTANFGFELFFNREAEVIHGKYQTGDNIIEVIPDVKADVSQVGVLADIAVLDSIVGQGISSDMVDILVNNTSRQVEQANKLLRDQASVFNPDTQTYEEPDSEEFKKSYKPWQTPENFAELVSKNIGNSAFLNPLPVRVIFSSLFMVEGLVTSMNVRFNKFSRNMVPVMCQVEIGMYALYIGAAKKDTFLYTNLKETAQQKLVDKNTNVNLQNILTSAMSPTYFDFIGFNDSNGKSIIGGKDYPFVKVKLKVSFDPTTATNVNANLDFAKALKQKLEKKDLKDIVANIQVTYRFVKTSTNLTSSEYVEMLTLKDGSTDIPFDNMKKGTQLYVSSERNDIVEKGYNKLEISLIEIQWLAKNAANETINSTIGTFKDQEWSFPSGLTTPPVGGGIRRYSSGNKLWNGPTTRVNPTSPGGIL